VDCYGTDGSAWVADTYNHRVVKLNADGTQALVVSLPNLMPMAVAVDPRNGDVWVGCAQKLLKLSGGTVVKDISGVYNVWNIALDPRDGSLALADEKAVRKFDADGNKVWEDTDYDLSYGVAVNKNTGVVWATDLLNPRLVEYSSVGNKQLEVTAGLAEPLDVALTY
jgi:DNA-binding beta-propeller fold protein YncE